MLFWIKLLFLKSISKAIRDLVLYIFLEGTNSSNITVVKRLISVIFSKIEIIYGFFENRPGFK